MVYIKKMEQSKRDEVGTNPLEIQKIKNLIE